MPVTWSDEKLILLYCPGRGSNSRPPAHHSFKHGQGVLLPYPLGHGGDTRIRAATDAALIGDSDVQICAAGSWTYDGFKQYITTA